MLIDTVDITVRSGKGGDGAISFRREKYVPKGGPDGGDGGKGGDVVLCSTNNLDTLSSFRFHKVFQAQDGEAGKGKKKTGSSADDLILNVPTGTIVTDLNTNQVIVDFTHNNQQKTILKGGRGGKGNVHFSTSILQKPEKSTQGESGKTLQLKLELRYVADIAIIGEPNVGKSSIISTITGAEARIGPYPFSTTHPILGVLHHEGLTVTLVDLPGLISGAHLGKGLGDDFLKHTQRVKGFLHVIDASSSEVKLTIQTVLNELNNYDPSLVKKNRQLVFNKIDLLTDLELKTLKKSFPKACFISTFNKTGITELKNSIIELIT